MDQASEYDTESEPEEDENVSAQESSQEVGGKNRELIRIFFLWLREYDRDVS